MSGSSVIFGSGGTGVVSVTGCGGAGVGGGGTVVVGGVDGGSGLAVGGSYNVDSPVALYVDYLDQQGNLCGTSGAACVAPSGTTAPDGWHYKRAWKIETPPGTTNLKQITVAAATSRGFGGATRATSFLTGLKTRPF